MFSRDTFDLMRQTHIDLDAAQYEIGTIGRLNSDGTYTIEVPDEPGMVYVTIQRNEGVAVDRAVNLGAALNPSLRVEMIRRNGRLVIIRPEASTALQLYGEYVSTAAVPPHYTSLATGNADPVESRRILPGLVYPHTGLTVKIYEFVHQGGFFPTTTVNLTSSVPGTSGQARWALITVDTATNTASVTNTTPITGGKDDLSLGSISSITISAGVIPLCAIALVNGQTTIDNTSRFVDAREFMTPRAAAATGYNPVDLYYTTDTTLTDGDITNQTRISVDASGGPVTITLPALATMNNYPVSITKIDSSGNTVTIDGNGSETIIGSAQVIIEYQWTTVTLIYNSAAPGSEWILV